MKKILKEKLEYYYGKYNKRELVNPDPLIFLYDYPKLQDREITALIASSFAYGRVSQILKNISFLLDAMQNSPYEFIANGNRALFSEKFKDFRYRFTSGETFINFLCQIKFVIEEYGSLQGCFHAGVQKNRNILPAIESFVDTLENGEVNFSHLLPRPSKGSACKRINLFLRWMVREDDVDPGGWTEITPKMLLIPMDTHMTTISTILGFSKSKNSNMKNTLAVTGKFSEISPEDPVKYDFSLTRFGIRDDLTIKELEENLKQ